MKAPIAVALDAPDLETAAGWANAVAPHVQVLKLGLEMVLAHGPAASAQVTKGLDVDLFLDLKLHDIPNTVAAAVHSVRDLEPRFVTVHALGGPTMIEAAAEAAPEIVIVGVTVLTSMNDADLVAVGLSGPPAAAVVRLARLAVDAGARALVCSPREVADVRAAVGPAITLITPGVRPTGSGPGDQRRVTTPEQAIAAGADLLVIGRPVTSAADPGHAVAAIAAALVM